MCLRNRLARIGAGFTTDAMNESFSNTKQHCPTSPVRSLLYCVELVQQVLEVKLETFFTYPVFMRYASENVNSMRAMAQCAKDGERLLRHVRTLHTILHDLGATTDDDMFPHTAHAASESYTSIVFQEELSLSILEACRECILGNWHNSSLRSSVIDHLDTIREETRNHLTTIQRLFAERQPRCRDAVLERFRVTALP